MYMYVRSSLFAAIVLSTKERRRVIDERERKRGMLRRGIQLNG
jgi:hypothetical protein